MGWNEQVQGWHTVGLLSTLTFIPSVIMRCRREHGWHSEICLNSWK